MRWRIIKAIYFKELRETLRDRRTVLFMLLLPVVLYPGMIIGLGKFQDSLEGQSKARQAKLTIWGDAPPELVEAIRSRNFTIRHQPKPLDGVAPFEEAPDPEDPKFEEKSEKLRDAATNHPLSVEARPGILDRSTDLVLVLWPGNNGARDAAILYDSVRQDSRQARSRLEGALNAYRKSLLQKRETERGLDRGFTRGIEVRARDVAPKARRSGFGIGMVLPFLLLAVSATAGFYRAVDTTAGEKERNTLQTLLCAPVRSLEVVAGKFAAISTVSMIATAANIASLGTTFSTMSRNMGGSGMALGLWHYLVVFLVLIPVALLTSALFLAVGVFAKDFRDGQNLMTPVMMLTMMPAAITMLPGVEANAYTLMAPCVNVAILIKALLVNEAKPDQIFITLVSSAAYAMLALAFAARVFERESLLTGGKDNMRGLFGLDSRRLEVTPSLAFASFCAVLVVLFYGTVLLKLPPNRLLLAVEYGLILLPTLAIVLAMRLPVAETLAIRWPGWPAMLSGVLVGISAWSVGVLSLRVLPPPESLTKALQKILLLEDDKAPIALVLFIGAISPAICEELFFRGLVQNGFRRLGMWTTIAASAILFGVAHGSIYRMLPVTILGLAIAWLAWHSKSVLPGIVAHMINNAIPALIVFHKPTRDLFAAEGQNFIPISWSLAGLVVMTCGLLLAARSTHRDRLPIQ